MLEWMMVVLLWKEGGLLRWVWVQGVHSRAVHRPPARWEGGSVRVGRPLEEQQRLGRGSVGLRQGVGGRRVVQLWVGFRMRER